VTREKKPQSALPSPPSAVSGLLGRERSLETVDAAVAASTADQTEAVLLTERSSLTRFAGSVVHQNMSETNAHLRIRAVLGAKIGAASDNRLDAPEVKKLAEKAVELARWQTENRDFVSLPGPAPAPEVEGYSEATDASTAEDRVAMVAEVVAEADAARAKASGSLSVTTREVSIANSLGTRVYTRGTMVQFITLVHDGEASGYADWVGTDISQLPARAVAARAAEKCARGRETASVAPGEYAVVLEPTAAADLVMFLGYLGFGALAFQEGRSFMSDRLGEQVTGPQITIWDDALDPRTFVMPFDYEGVPRQPVILIERGVARGVCYDSYTATRDGKQSTGHSLPQPNSHGPFPLNLFLGAGDAAEEDMIAGTERGILVTRFHYTNVIQPKETTITGMTRDGTFLIEDGKLGRAVQNLRFTENVLAALRGTEMVGREARLTPYEIVAPALKLASWRFTS